MVENFSNIKDILNGIEFNDISPIFAQLVSDWEILVGKKFAGKTQITNIVRKGNKTLLFIQTSTSPMAQELTFFKRNLLKKIRAKYNIDIFDIITKVSPKNNYFSQKNKPNIVQETYNERPTKEELNNVILEEKIIKEIKKSVQNQTTLSEIQKKRMLDVIINDLKTQEWMKQKGFPTCKKCGRVLTRKNFGEENFCIFCKKQDSE